MDNDAIMRCLACRDVVFVNPSSESGEFGNLSWVSQSGYTYLGNKNLTGKAAKPEVILYNSLFIF
jgi:hypothetical protein